MNMKQIFHTKSGTVVATLLVAGILCATTKLAVAQEAMVTQKPEMKMTTPIPKDITTPDKVQTPIGELQFFDGIPIGDTKENVYDYMDRARAVMVYVNMLPAVSTYSLLQGSRDMNAGNCNQILIWEQTG